MDTDASKQLIRRFVQEIFVEGRPDSVDELVAPDFESHTWPSTGDGRADLKAAIERVGKALEDVRFEVEDLIAEGDRVVARVTSSARQVGEFMGLPPSGRGYRVEEIHIFRVRNGQVVEHWLQMDSMGMLQQLGAMPAKG